MYADFNKEESVFVIPHIPRSVKDFEKSAYEYAKSSIAHCHNVLSKARRADPGAPLRQELKERQSSLSPAAGFFGASLVMCLMGIGSGAFFFTKQPN
ncbi:phosphoribosylaminoimidazole carboxylase [Dissostichus eleginoides]|uniref:Phosphoribosylaminoimidazole carboxylase n=1 Tax=Dissostichus eleginoides TaxID=100907 RepID=A0AAD9CFT9_DISEL|nr:phosphoribosylaminoimidazole carboxylase [Dissostichus eleginoides]